jgi:hypothetical protein
MELEPNTEAPRKFNKWSDDKNDVLRSFVQSIMHPVSKSKMKSHAALIKLEYTPSSSGSGYRVLSGEAIPLSNLGNDRLENASEQFEHFFSTQDNSDDEFDCFAIFDYQSDDEQGMFFKFYGFGSHANQAQIRKDGAMARGIHNGLMMMINGIIPSSSK